MLSRLTGGAASAALMALVACGGGSSDSVDVVVTQAEDDGGDDVGSVADVPPDSEAGESDSPGPEAGLVVDPPEGWEFVHEYDMTLTEVRPDPEWPEDEQVEWVGRPSIGRKYSGPEMESGGPMGPSMTPLIVNVSANYLGPLPTSTAGVDRAWSEDDRSNQEVDRLPIDDKEAILLRTEFTEQDIIYLRFGDWEVQLFGDRRMGQAELVEFAQGVSLQ